MHIEYYLGGYFMSLENTLRFMQNKGIDDKNIDDYRRDRPLKDWLARNNRKDVLCGAIIHPNTPPGYDPYKLIADGILFVTGFFGALNRDGEPTLAENDEARQIKEWLVSGGIDEKDIEWVTVWDDWGVFYEGIHPKRNSRSGKLPRLQPPVHLSHEEYMAMNQSHGPSSKRTPQAIAEKESQAEASGHVGKDSTLDNETDNS